MQRIKAATLVGVFTQYGSQQETDKLQAVWGQLPAGISTQAESKYLYANTLRQAGADLVCAAFIVDSNKAVQDEKLVELYGRLRHDDMLPQAIVQAQQWLDAQPDNPVNLLLSGRLYKEQKDYEQARQYYVSSLNQAPNAAAYLELAEMLEIMGEHEQAARCYRVGLRCSIRGEGERLVQDSATRLLKVAG